MSQEIKHTPTPWKYKDDGFVGAIYGSNDEPVFGGESHEGRIEPDDPNKDFVLKAVNSHEMLLEAAKRALNAMKAPNDMELWEESKADLVDAIAKAEEVKP